MATMDPLVRGLLRGDARICRCDDETVGEDFTGLNRRDAAQKAIDAAAKYGAPVYLHFRGAAHTVFADDTVDGVARYIAG